MIARTGCQDQEVCGAPFAFDGVARFLGGGVHRDDVRAIHFASGCLRALEEQAVQDSAGIDDDGIGHFELGALFVGGNQVDGVDQFLGVGIVEKKREPLDGFVSESAAAGLFPCEMFIKNANGVAGAGKLFATHRAGRSAADDYDFSHLVSLAN